MNSKINKSAITKTEATSVAKVKKSNILRPRITEKASLQSNVNAYTFIVSNTATKLTVKDEIKKTHGVTPTKVNISNLPAKKVFVRGASGVKSGLKKATVFLKKGDTLKLV